MPNNNWESDETTLKNELKLIDDSYYRVYDDNDYETWRERMLLIIDSQSKLIVDSNEDFADKISNSAKEKEGNAIESTVNEINPIKPVILNLPNETIYQGIHPKPPNLENYNTNVSWGMKYLLGEIDQKCQDPSKKSHYKNILMDSKPGKSKWGNANRAGQDELYPGLEKVLVDLKAYTPYSIPFLVKVSKKDVPDYHNVIKRPMDLGTMAKKLKAQEYNSKQQFVDDLNLIYNNCFTYNTAEDSIYRQHIQMLRDKWTYLLKSVPDIVVGRIPEKPKESLQLKPSTTIIPTIISIPPKSKVADSTDQLDDLDDLLNAHLESLSDSESCPSPKKQRKSSLNELSHSRLDELSARIPKRCEKLMIKYSTDCKAAWSMNETQSLGSSFVFPELVYFFNTVPDAHLIKKESALKSTKSSYSPINKMNKFYDNFRILQSIRALRKHILEGSRAEVPSIEHLKTPSERFEKCQNSFEEVIENSWQSKIILRKIIALYLAQAGFELISNSALHAFYELVDWTLTKLFDTLKLLTEQFSTEKDSAEILRLSLLQMNLKHLSDLDVVMTEDSYANERLNHLLNVMCDKVQEYQLSLRRSENPDEGDSGSGEELNENDEDEDDEDREQEEDVEEEAVDEEEAENIDEDENDDHNDNDDDDQIEEDDEDEE